MTSPTNTTAVLMGSGQASMQCRHPVILSLHDWSTATLQGPLGCRSSPPSAPCLAAPGYAPQLVGSRADLLNRSDGPLWALWGTIVSQQLDQGFQHMGVLQNNYHDLDMTKQSFASAGRQHSWE